MKDFIATFRDRLEVLERERVKVRRDQKAFLFLATLVFALGCCCFIAGLMGHAIVIITLGLGLICLAQFVRRLSERIDETYQLNFREQVTRDWFHARSIEASNEAYLVPGIADKDLPVQLKTEVKEVCWRLFNQEPARTIIEERIFFEPDSADSGTWILKRRPLLPWGPPLRSVAWFLMTPHASGADEKKQRDLRQFVVSTGGFSKNVKTAVTPTGIRVGARLEARPFAAPVLTSALEPGSYQSWEADFKRLGTPAIARALLAF